MKTSWWSFEKVLKMSWQDVLKMSERIVEDALKNIKDVLIRRLENALKTSWRRKFKVNIFVLIKTSWRQRQKVSSWRLQDVLTKTTVCWSWSLFTKISSILLIFLFHGDALAFRSNLSTFLKGINFDLR